MRQIRLALFAAAAALLPLLSHSIWAHHSGAIYDREHPITMSGTVTAFEFVNPHALIHFEVKDASGNLVKWVAISGPPQTLFRQDGWTKNTLKPGDKITLTIKRNGNERTVQVTLGQRPATAQ